MCIVNSSEGKCNRDISSKDWQDCSLDQKTQMFMVVVFDAISSSTIIVPIANMVPASKNCKAHTWLHI